MKNNKGVSAVIATVLIILITIAAVTIIWAAIIPMIQNLIRGGTVCMEVMKDVEIGDRTCFNSTSKNLSIQVTRKSGEYGVEKIDIVVEDKDGDTNVTTINSTIITGHSYYRGHPDANGAKVYIIPQGSINPKRVSVAASVTKEGKLSDCQATEPKIVVPCA